MTCPFQLPAQLTGVSPDPRSAFPGTAATSPAAVAIPNQAAFDGDFFVAWVDTRNTWEGEIFFKRTDRTPPGAVENLAASADTCPDNDITVAWQPPPDCDVAVYHVTATGPETIQVDVFPPETSVVLDITLDGSYDITVVAEDGACNQSMSTLTTRD